MQRIARYSLTFMLLASVGLHATEVANADGPNPAEAALVEPDRPFMAYEIWQEVEDSSVFDRAGSPIRFSGAVREHARSVKFGPDRQPIRNEAWHAAIHDEPLHHARARLRRQLLDYFAEYSHPSARMITAEHR
jgi:hypothetical protein